MKKLILFLITLSITNFLLAQNNKVSSESGSSLGEVSDTVRNAEFFGVDDPLPITLKYDITSFIKNKRKGEYLDAELIVNYKDLTVITKNIRIKARGNFRRGECFFPPLFLNFKTDPIENVELKGAKKIKVVTPCSNSKYGETYVFKEYLVYKLYSILNDASFKVRLLDIKYVDTGKKERNYKKFGFIIEPIDLVAKRNNATEIDSEVVQGTDIKEKAADRVAMFRYMISDTDWKFKGGHNMKYIKSLTDFSNKVIAVPYDFDFSGFVNTNYSFPQEWAPASESVLDRQFLGYCRDNDQNYLNSIELFNNKKDELLKTITDFEYLSEKEKKSLVAFVNDFFEEISQPEKFVKNIKYYCKEDDF